MLNRPKVDMTQYGISQEYADKLTAIHAQQDAELRDKLMCATALLMSELSEQLTSAGWLGDWRQHLLQHEMLKCSTITLSDFQYVRYMFSKNETDDLLHLAIYCMYYLLGEKLPDYEYLEKAWEK